MRALIFDPLTHTHKHTQTHTNTHKHTPHKHTQTHTNTHKHTHTHTRYSDPWARIEVEGQKHYHAFTKNTTERKLVS